ncbi:hypothetical protein ACS0TY_021939 [Phlomoides rotata]
MLTLSTRPNNYTFPLVFKACAGIRDLSLGKTVPGSFSKLRLCDVRYVKWGMSREAVKLFRRMQNAECRMQNEDVRPDGFICMCCYFLVWRCMAVVWSAFHCLRR